MSVTILIPFPRTNSKREQIKTTYTIRGNIVPYSKELPVLLFTSFKLTQVRLNDNEYTYPQFFKTNYGNTHLMAAQ